MRVESVTTTMPQSIYNELLMQRGGRYGLESMAKPDLELSDLDEDVIIGAVRAGIDSGRLPESTIREEIPTILEKFDLLHNHFINNAAAVLFGNKFYNYPQCLLRMARFKGKNKNEFIDNQRINGNIYNLLDAAMNFFFKHLSISGKIEKMYREEELSIPYKALRECCINAFAHRHYHHPGSSVSIAIYDDRVEITNSGNFPAGMSVERILNTHDSQPQNPIIANVLYKSKVLENWGRGIGLMVEECRRVGIQDPEFHTDGGFVWVVFHYSQPADIIPTSTPQAPHKVKFIDKPQEEAIIQVLLNGILSVKEIMNLMNLKDRKSFLHSYLYPAIENGLVEPIYPNQPKHPKQKYRLTEKGKQHKNEN